jgi:NitT/TauT family transport system substrate-binding protein
MIHNISNSKYRLKTQPAQNKKYVPIILVLVLTIAVLTSYYPLVNTYAQTDTQVPKTLKIGYFPNINHAQAVIGLNNGDFQKILGNTKVETVVFNAGPSAIEALLAKRIDATYIGPNPAINGFVASGGNDVRVIAGATSGGASFVVRNDAGIESANDLGGKKFASPQLGNTQDISLRKYLINNGYDTIENGGDVTVVPVSNADIVTLFLKKEIDGAWVPEPWATTLVNEANGKILVDERDLWPPEGKFVTANIIVRTDYLQENPDVVEKLLEAHVNQTLWINNNKEKAINEFNIQLKKLTGKTIPQAVLANAVTKLEFTYDPIKLSLIKDANDAYDLGLLQKGKERPNLTNIYDLTVLDKVLAQKGLDTVSGVNIEPTINIGNNTSTNGTSGDALSDIVT